MAMMKYPRRTKRRRETQNRILNAASEVFAKHGFESTTMEMVAEIADVHVQTLYRHFPGGKEVLAIAPDWIVYERFMRELQNPERIGTTFRFWRDFVASRAQETAGTDPLHLVRHVQFREAVPALSTAYLRLSHAYEDALAESFARDFGLDPSADQFPRILACMLWSAHQYVLRRWAQSGGKRDLVTDDAAMIDDVVDTLASRGATLLARLATR